MMFGASWSSGLHHRLRHQGSRVRNPVVPLLFRIQIFFSSLDLRLLLTLGSSLLYDRFTCLSMHDEVDHQNLSPLGSIRLSLDAL